MLEKALFPGPPSSQDTMVHGGCVVGPSFVSSRSRVPRLLPRRTQWFLYDPLEADEYVYAVRGGGDFDRWPILGWVLMSNHSHLVVKTFTTPVAICRGQITVVEEILTNLATVFKRLPDLSETCPTICLVAPTLLDSKR